MLQRRSFIVVASLIAMFTVLKVLSQDMALAADSDRTISGPWVLPQFTYEVPERWVNYSAKIGKGALTPGDDNCKSNEPSYAILPPTLCPDGAASTALGNYNCVDKDPYYAPPPPIVCAMEEEMQDQWSATRLDISQKGSTITIVIYSEELYSSLRHQKNGPHDRTQTFEGKITGDRIDLVAVARTGYAFKTDILSTELHLRLRADEKLRYGKIDGNFLSGYMVWHAKFAPIQTFSADHSHRTTWRFDDQTRNLGLGTFYWVPSKSHIFLYAVTTHGLLSIDELYPGVATIVELQIDRPSTALEWPVNVHAGSNKLQLVAKKSDELGYIFRTDPFVPRSATIEKDQAFAPKQPPRGRQR